MSSEAITKWIEELRVGNSLAAEKLWQQYFQQIVELARKRLRGANHVVADEEDVALSAFKSMCLGARDGKYPSLLDRESLWSLLVAITVHKSIDMVRRENRKKRGGTGRPASASEDDRSAHRRSVIPLSEVIRSEPTPDMLVQLDEQLELLLSQLKQAHDPDLVTIALAKIQGDSTTEIANQLGCVRRTVERKVSLIRSIWMETCD